MLNSYYNVVPEFKIAFLYKFAALPTAFAPYKSLSKLFQSCRQPPPCPPPSQLPFLRAVKSKAFLSGHLGGGTSLIRLAQSALVDKINLSGVLYGCTVNPYNRTWLLYLPTHFQCVHVSTHV